MTSAKPDTAPSATATPGTSCTRRTRPWSSGRTWPPVVATSASKAASDFTTTSVPAVRPSYSSSKAFTMVSESTNVPETNVTPTVTAAIVSSRRSLFFSRLRSEIRNILSHPVDP